MKLTQAVMVLAGLLVVTSCGVSNPSATPSVTPPAAAHGTTTGATQVHAAAPAHPAAGETTVACSPSACGVHFVGQTLTFGPVYAFTATVSGSTYPAFRVDNIRLAIDPGSRTGEFGDQGLAMTDNQYNKTGQGKGPTSTELAASYPQCLSASTPGYHASYQVVAGVPLSLPKGVCFGFPDDKPPVVATTLNYFDGYPIPLTPVGK